MLVPDEEINEDQSKYEKDETILRKWWSTSQVSLIIVDKIASKVRGDIFSKTLWKLDLSFNVL